MPVVLGLMEHTFNTSTQETEAGGFLWIQYQLGLHSMFLVSYDYKVIPCLKTVNQWQCWVTETYILLNWYNYFYYHCLNVLFLIYPYYTFCGSAKVGYTFEIDTSKHLLHCFYPGPNFLSIAILFISLFLFLSSVCLKAIVKIISLKCDSLWMISWVVSQCTQLNSIPL